MNLSREAMLALERHFVGALSAPARTWLEPAPVSGLAFAGSILRSHAGECEIDFATVESPGRECRLVRVGNRGAHPVLVRIGESPAWLVARWHDVAYDVLSIAPGSVETMELIAEHDSESRFQGCIRFAVTDEGGPRIEELPVRMTTRRAYPVAHLDFNGSPVPRPFDLGNGVHPYRLGVTNSSSVPLIVRFSDLPAWLTFEIGGQRRQGPIPGPFFERRAPFTVQLWARPEGRQHDVLLIQSNDPRPQYRSIALQLSAYGGVPKPEARSATSVTTVRIVPEPEPVPSPRLRKPVTARIDIIGAVAVLLLILVVLIVRGLS
ncbi:MAG TPA: hypothetical protein VGR95_18345 [Thermoanaerobaculia bacterium]|jgi:hypothetical protein|nr:hypothetical protein [Thermoanaerobaculia bacterium]